MIVDTNCVKNIMPKHYPKVLQPELRYYLKKFLGGAPKLCLGTKKILCHTPRFEN